VWIPFKRSCVGGNHEQLIGDTIVDIPISAGITPGTTIATGGRQYTIRIEEDNVFSRVGFDIHCAVVVEGPQAQRGGYVVVPTLEGRHLKVAMEPQTIDGQQIILPGKGITTSEGDIGDLVVTIRIRSGTTGVEGGGRIPLKPTKNG